MTHNELVQTLHDAGFMDGWILVGTELTFWEHDVEPPLPLTRPDITIE